MIVEALLAASVLLVPGVGDGPSQNAPESDSNAQGVPWAEELEDIPVLPVVRPVSVVQVIHDRAAAHGVSGARLEAVARCESRLNPRAVGDSGRSLGLFQLNRAGLLREFYAMGYSDPFNAWEAADYTAWAFAHGRAGHWSCAR